MKKIFCTLALLFFALPSQASEQMLICYSGSGSIPLSVKVSFDSKGTPVTFKQFVGGGAGATQELDYTSVSTDSTPALWPLGKYQGTLGTLYGLLKVSKGESGSELVGTYQTNSLHRRLPVTKMFCSLQGE